MRDNCGRTDAAFRGWLKELRESAGLSQDDLAQAVGTDRRNIRRWEVEGHEPGGTVLLRLLSAVGVELSPPAPIQVPRAVSAELRGLSGRLASAEERWLDQHSRLLDRLEAQEELVRVLTVRLGETNGHRG